MPSQMTLNLRLNGIQNLVQSIQALNRALNVVNNKFNVVAGNINNAAQRINSAAANLRSAGRVGPIRSRNVGGGQSGGNQLQDFDQQHLGSVFFSGFAGAWQIMGAKIFTRLATQVSQGVLKNHPLNPASASMQNAASNSIHSQTNWTNYLKVLGQRILLVAAGLYLMYEAIKTFVSAVKWAFDSVKSMAMLTTAKGVPGVEGAIRGIGAAFNMDPEKLAGVINGEPGGARGFIQKIKALKNIVDQNPEGASYAAEAMGMSEFLPGLESMSKQDLEDALNTNSTATKTSKFWVNELNQELGKLKLTLSSMAELLSPLVVLATIFVKTLRAIGEAIKFLFSGTIWGVLDKLGNALMGDKQGKSIDKFSRAVDDFGEYTDKIGTFGGGPRGRSPIPRAWTWWQYQRELREQAENLGAFQF